MVCDPVFGRLLGKPRNIVPKNLKNQTGRMCDTIVCHMNTIVKQQRSQNADQSINVHLNKITKRMTV